MTKKQYLDIYNIVVEERERKKARENEQYLPEDADYDTPSVDEEELEREEQFIAKTDLPKKQRKKPAGNRRSGSQAA